MARKALMLIRLGISIKMCACQRSCPFLFLDLLSIDM